MEFEFWILDFLQTLHHPLLDVLMKGASFLGNGGILWIILTIVLLCIPKTRTAGMIMAVSLCADALLCNVLLKPAVARIRPYDVNTAVSLLIKAPLDYSFPSGHTAASFAAVSALYFADQKKTVEDFSDLCRSDCIFQNVSVCALSNRYFRRNRYRYFVWLYWLLGDQSNKKEIRELGVVIH